MEDQKGCLNIFNLFCKKDFMPRRKNRINLSIDDDLYDEFKKLKEIRKTRSLSAVVLELVKEALEFQEDLYFARVADERKTETVISHLKTWKN
jgi:predicted CopG family antitoxin